MSPELTASELHYLWAGQVRANLLDYYHYYHTNGYQVCELTQCFQSFSSITEWVYGNAIILAISQFIKVSTERPNRICYAEWTAALAKPGNEKGNCSCCRLKKSFSFPFWKQLGCGLVLCLSYQYVGLHEKMRLDAKHLETVFLRKLVMGNRNACLGWGMLSRKVLTGHEWCVVPWEQFSDCGHSWLLLKSASGTCVNSKCRGKHDFFADVTIRKTIQIWKKE